jgi:hypothetical protein
MPYLDSNKWRVWIVWQMFKKKLRGFGPLANYADRGYDF